MPEVKECRKCDIAWGLIGIGTALIAAYMSVDLLTGGALSAVVFRAGRAGLASVSTIGTSDDSGELG